MTRPQRRVNNREFRLGPATLVYQLVLRAVLGGGYDAAVLTTESKFVSTETCNDTRITMM